MLIRRVFVVLAGLLAMVGSPASAQEELAVLTGSRVQVELQGERGSVLRRPSAQRITGSLTGLRGDTLLLETHPGVAPLMIPRSAIVRVRVSRGHESRFESALRRAAFPTLASAAFGALGAILGEDGDRSAGEAALRAAGRTALLTGAIGFLSPRERWRRAGIPAVPPPPSEPPVIIRGAASSRR